MPTETVNAQNKKSKITTLIRGDSNFNHIEPPEGVVISNISGAKLEDAIKLVEQALCNIPSRKGGVQQSECNETAKSINSFMDLVSRQQTQVVYIDTWSPMWSSQGYVIKRYYARDQSGVLLSKDGKSLIMKHIMDTI